MGAYPLHSGSNLNGHDAQLSIGAEAVGHRDRFGHG